MPNFKLISADSHVFEPREMWVDYIDPAFRDRAPRIVTNPGDKKGDFFVVPGQEPEKVGGGFSAGASPEELKKMLEEASVKDQCPLGAYIPSERQKEIEVDGVEAEIIYTTLGFRLFRLTDAPYQQALFRAFNTWISEYCNFDKKRFIGLGLISLLDVEAGVTELRRCADLGLRGALIMASPPDGVSYADPKFEPLWAAASELDMPISLHILTGHGEESRNVGKFKQNHYLRAISIIHEVQRSLTEIMFSGAFERHPNLKIVSAENDIGWVPHFLYRADHFHDKAKYSNPTTLKMYPTEYAKRQFFVTYMDDPVGVRLYDYFGEDNYAWASDYPHAQSTFPNSRKIVDENFAGIPDRVKRKITRDNCIRLYNMRVN
jgi:predicted TIM-barrel fold metal-dependent hydrolase